MEQLTKWIQEAEHMVFFGGAGVSTESQIPDFRSESGLYNKQYAYPAEVMLSHTFFEKDPQSFFEFYFDQMIYPKAIPNHAHLALAKLEEMGKCQAVITQNIDGLHQKAGSKRVYELHGSVWRNTCLSCHHTYSLEQVLTLRDEQGIPRCPVCGHIIKPDVVLYEEGLDEKTLSSSVKMIERADLLIVGGTSLAVYPAAGLLRYFSGSRLVLINKSSTPYDRMASLVLHDPIGKVFQKTMEELKVVL